MTWGSWVVVLWLLVSLAFVWMVICNLHTRGN